MDPEHNDPFIRAIERLKRRALATALLLLFLGELAVVLVVVGYLLTSHVRPSTIAPEPPEISDSIVTPVSDARAIKRSRELKPGSLCAQTTPPGVRRLQRFAIAGCARPG